jgi:hypothetical protein
MRHIASFSHTVFVINSQDGTISLDLKSWKSGVHIPGGLRFMPDAAPCLWRLQLDQSDMQPPHGIACPTESVHKYGVLLYHTVTFNRPPFSPENSRCRAA